MHRLVLPLKPIMSRSYKGACKLQEFFLIVTRVSTPNEESYEVVTGVSGVSAPKVKIDEEGYGSFSLQW
jgi:hypothetical protein